MELSKQVVLELRSMFNSMQSKVNRSEEDKKSILIYDAEAKRVIVPHHYFSIVMNDVIFNNHACIENNKLYGFNYTKLSSDLFFLCLEEESIGANVVMTGYEEMTDLINNFNYRYSDSCEALCINRKIAETSISKYGNEVIGFSHPNGAFYCTSRMLKAVTSAVLDLHHDNFLLRYDDINRVFHTSILDINSQEYEIYFSGANPKHCLYESISNVGSLRRNIKTILKSSELTKLLEDIGSNTYEEHNNFKRPDNYPVYGETAKNPSSEDFSMSEAEELYEEFVDDLGNLSDEKFLKYRDEIQALLFEAVYNSVESYVKLTKLLDGIKN